MKRIEIIEVEDCFNVIIGDQIAIWCGRDEALGVVAAALFSSPAKIPYMRSYEELLDHLFRWAIEPAALLTDQRVTGNVAIRFPPNPHAKVTHQFRYFSEGVLAGELKL